MKPNQTTFKTILNKYGIAIVLLAMILFLSIVKPNFRTWDNLLNILTQIDPARQLADHQNINVTQNVVLNLI